MMGQFQIPYSWAVPLGGIPKVVLSCLSDVFQVEPVISPTELHERHIIESGPYVKLRVNCNVDDEIYWAICSMMCMSHHDLLVDISSADTFYRSLKSYRNILKEDFPWYHQNPLCMRLVRKLDDAIELTEMLMTFHDIDEDTKTSERLLSLTAYLGQCDKICGIWGVHEDDVLKLATIFAELVYNAW